MMPMVQRIPMGQKRVLLIILTAIAYASLGWLSTFLAIPPGYASPVWPAAGVALVVVLAIDTKIWPGIWLGSFVINNWIGWQATGDLTLSSVLTAAGIACGAVLQALWGRWLLLPLLHDRTWLGTLKGIVQFLCLAGPVSCLVGASLGNVVLLVSGIVPLGEFLTSWFNWWIGDMLGVLALLPIGAIYLTRLQAVRLKQLLPQVLPALTTLVITVCLFLNVRAAELTRTQVAFSVHTTLLSQALQANLDQTMDILYVLGAYQTQLYLKSRQDLTSTSPVAWSDRQGFHNLARVLLQQHPGIQALSWTPVVLHADRSLYEQQARTEGLTNFQFQERNAAGQLVPDRPRSVYYPVFFIEPISTNETALGFNLGSEPDRLQTLEQARKTAAVRATPGLELVQETEHQTGTIAYLPLFSTPSPSPNPRQETLLGFIGLVLRLDNWLATSLSTLAPPGIYLQLVDVTDRSTAQNPTPFSTLPASPETPSFYATAYPTAPSEPLSLFSVPAQQPATKPLTFLQTAQNLTFAQRTWQLQFAALREFLQLNQTRQPWFVLTGGFLFTGLTGAFVLSLAHRTAQIQLLVKQRTTELELARQAAEQAAQKAETANRTKSDFLAMMSHEIRTPMNGVTGVAELLLATPLNPDQKQLLEIIHASGNTLLTVINDILDFSKLEAGRVQLEVIEFDLWNCVEEVINLFKTSAFQKGLNLTYQIESDVPRSIRSDPVRLRQILMNLIGNGVKFTKNGEIEVNLRRLKLEKLPGLDSELNLDLSPDRNPDPDHFSIPILQPNSQPSLESNSQPNSQPNLEFNLESNLEPNLKTILLEFSVRDTGIGIATHQQNQLFQPFSQADSSITRQYGGTGLGLVICKQLCELLGGTIEVESEEGIGSIFRFRIRATIDPSSPQILEPILEPTLEPKFSTSAKTDRTNHPDLQILSKQSSLRILLVEDNLVNQKVAFALLNYLGYQADWVSNGLEALEALKQQSYDVIFMDMQMPEMDGLETTRRIRQQTLSANRPVDRPVDRPYIIAMTANALPDDRASCLDAGMNDYVTKPLQLEVLVKALYRAFQEYTLRG